MGIPKGYRMHRFWESVAYNDALSTTAREAARREMNRWAYQSMTYKEAVLMVWEEQKQHWDPDNPEPPSIWNVISDICTVVALNYGIPGGYPFNHRGDVLSDAYQIVLRRHHERHGREIHPDFLD